MSKNLDAESLKLLEKKFDELDKEMKAAISDWQGSYVNDAWVPNIHGDSEKDFIILERLFKLYDRLTVLFDKNRIVQKNHKELERIVHENIFKLKTAVEQIEKGDFTFVDAPDKESFHTSWMNLHQSLITFLKKISR
jgi:hypothetical protein